MRSPSLEEFRSLSDLLPQPWKPAKHHRLGVEFLLTHAAAGLLLDPGLGKTSISYKAFSILKKEGAVEVMLVVTMLRPAHLVWPKEARKWKDFNHLKVEVLHGPHKDEALARRADVYVVNIDGLPWLLRHPLFRKKFKGAVLAVDESSKFKRTNTRRFKILKPKLNLFARRWILTGSPAPKGLLDLFGQMYILDGGNALGSFITHYRMQWFTPTGFGGYDWVPRDAEAEADIYDAIAPLCLRMSEEDYLKLPPIKGMIGKGEPLVRGVLLPSDAMRHYKEMEALLLTQVLENDIAAANAAVASQKCRQIANGGLYVDEWEGKKPKGKVLVCKTNKRLWLPMHDEKTEAVCELVDELSGKPALIAFDFSHDLDRLLRGLPPGGAVIGGGVSMKETIRIEELWNRGRLPWLLANPQSVAHGLNIQESGSTAIWHSLTWNWEDYDQFCRRIYRTGQKLRVFIWHIVALGTLDEVMMQVLAGKDRTQRALFTALKAYAAAVMPAPALPARRGRK